MTAIPGSCLSHFCCHIRILQEFGSSPWPVLTLHVWGLCYNFAEQKWRSTLCIWVSSPQGATNQQIISLAQLVLMGKTSAKEASVQVSALHVWQGKHHVNKFLHEGWHWRKEFPAGKLHPSVAWGERRWNSSPSCNRGQLRWEEMTAQS